MSQGRKESSSPSHVSGSSSSPNSSRCYFNTSGVRVQLTKRQQEVMLLLCNDGLSTEDLAAKLCIAQATVRNHIQDIMLILGVHTRLEIASHIASQGDGTGDGAVAVVGGDFRLLSRNALIAELTRVTAELQPYKDREQREIELAEQAARARVELEKVQAEQAKFDELMADAERAKSDLAQAQSSRDRSRSRLQRS